MTKYVKNKTGLSLTAKVISNLANPLSIPPIVFIVIGYTASLPYESFNRLIAISICFFTFIPIIIALIVSHKHPSGSLDFPERTALYGFSIVSTFIGSSLILWYFVNSSLRLVALIFL